MILSFVKRFFTSFSLLALLGWVIYFLYISYLPEYLSSELILWRYMLSGVVSLSVIYATHYIKVLQWAYILSFLAWIWLVISMSIFFSVIVDTSLSLVPLIVWSSMIVVFCLVVKTWILRMIAFLSLWYILVSLSSFIPQQDIKPPSYFFMERDIQWSFTQSGDIFFLRNETENRQSIMWRDGTSILLDPASSLSFQEKKKLTAMSYSWTFALLDSRWWVSLLTFSDAWSSLSALSGSITLSDSSFLSHRLMGEIQYWSSKNNAVSFLSDHRISYTAYHEAWLDRSKSYSPYHTWLSWWINAWWNMSRFLLPREHQRDITFLYQRDHYFSWTWRWYYIFPLPEKREENTSIAVSWTIPTFRIPWNALRYDVRWWFE